MKKTTATEKYIKKAVNQAKEAGIGGHSLSHCNVNMEVNVGDAAKVLAEAMGLQAEANFENAKAMKELAMRLKQENITAIKIG